MAILNPYEWRVLQDRPGKRLLAKVDATTMELIICEEWTEDWCLEQARQEREAPALVGADLKPLAVIPPSVQSKAINEGWANDRKQWKKWMNDIDNRYLRTSDGTA